MITPIPRDIPELPPIPGVPVLMPSDVPAAAVVTPVSRPLVAAFRLLVALAAFTGVTLALLQGRPVRALSLFAVQSGVLVALVFTASAQRAWTARRPLPSAITGGTLLYATITGLVHHVLLTHGPSSFTTPGRLPDGSTTADGTGLSGLVGPNTWPLFTHHPWPTLAGHLLHTVIPVAAALDWLLLTTPGRLALRQATAWLLYPLAYLALTLTRGELLPPDTPGGRYLYPFLDVDHHGYKTVLGNALLLGLSIYALGVLLVTLDHIRPDPTRRRADRHRPKTGFRLRPPVG
ncbi:hypothetical protein OK074_2591 [Actinobacteria bacterium OK074]|nr:hypothetical protein OK074_2591 [Actinobacteria bacterium OK074]